MSLAPYPYLRPTLLLLGAALLCAACQSSTEPAPPAPPTTTPPREAAPPATPDAPEPGTTPASAPGEEPTATHHEEAELEPAADAAPATHPTLAFGEDWGPISDDQRQRLAAVPWDDPPERLDAIKEDHVDKHFLWSDERNPHLFGPHIRDLHGAYVGIGTDQSYLFVGWQRPHLAWFIDYDPWVVWLHHAYFAFIESSPDAQAFMALFADREAGLALLETFYQNHPNRADILKVFREARSGVHRRLRTIQRDFAKSDLPTFLTDADTYDFIRQLIRNGRAHTLLGNLLSDRALLGIGRACAELQVPVRVLYLSNAEQYWSYPQQFKDNMLGLPFDARSVVLRTAATKPHNEDYRYALQPGAVFHTWLRLDRVRSVRQLSRRVRVTGLDDFPFTIDDRLPTPEDGLAE